MFCSKNEVRSISSELLGDFKNPNILSFNLDEDYVAAVAFDNNGFNSDRIFIYNLLTFMEELMLFGNINDV
ncbi:hypothetical protein [Winogradskyella sp. R77965]|uniref:hypothetical protein n=1 Tax=Winogradskyella sp. R77965 TaxID=3093872 RepID=UPI0037DD8B31